MNRRRPLRSLSKRKIINQINWFHFIESPILVHLRDIQFGNEFLVQASPDTCLGDAVSCSWTAPLPAGGRFEVLELVISDGLTITLIPLTDVKMKEGSFTARLPENGSSFGGRSSKRYEAVDGIRAEISQSGFNASGILVDFSSLTFRIRVEAEEPVSFHWFHPDRNILVRLSSGKDIVYQGICRCVRQTLGNRRREIVLRDLGEYSVAGAKGKHKRSPRRTLQLGAFLTFRHPLSGQDVQRDIDSISMTGFSVWERKDEGVLMQGMVLPEARIRFYGNIEIRFRCRVVQRRNRSGRTLCGISFLDMEMKDVRLLSYILANISDPHLFVSREPNMDALWNFLFETGFLYPKKYGMIQEHRESLKETFRKLYCLHPDIADHFLYQRDGKIYGHVSMVRAFERGWVLHHLAALRMGSARVALALMKQAVEYFEGIHRFPSMRMDYLIFYYRPENRFPNLIGEFAQSLKNPKGCSQDLFAYLDVHTTGSSAALPAGWSLEEFLPEHRSLLEQHYEHVSGGLLLDVILDRPGRESESEIEAVYRRHGMKRRIRTFSLLHRDRLKAVLWQSESDLGLNLSELLNAVKVVVVDPQTLPWTILKAAATRLAACYTTEHVPLLVFPSSYLAEQNVRFDKQYMMWVMDVQFGRAYIDYMETRIRRSKRLVMLFGWLRKVLNR